MSTESPTGYAGPAGLDMDALFAAPPDQQNQMIGKVLWPKIQDIQPQLAGKIWDMVFEMDNNELIDLVFDGSALRAKIGEVMKVFDEDLKDESSDGTKEGSTASEESLPAPRS